MTFSHVFEHAKIGCAFNARFELNISKCRVCLFLLRQIERVEKEKAYSAAKKT